MVDRYGSPFAAINVVEGTTFHDGDWPRDCFDRVFGDNQVVKARVRREILGQSKAGAGMA